MSWCLYVYNKAKNENILTAEILEGKSVPWTEVCETQMARKKDDFSDHV